MYFFAFSNDLDDHLKSIQQVDIITVSKRTCIYYTASTLNLITNSLPPNLRLSGYALNKHKAFELVKLLNWNVIFLDLITRDYWQAIFDKKK